MRNFDAGRPRRDPVDHRLRQLLAIAAPATTRSATTPTPTARRPAPPSSAARRRPARFDGLQAENARIPFANVGLVKLPDEVTDDQAILLSDIFPTGYFGADLAEIKPGDTVAVFGCGPVGQFAIASAKLLGAGRVFAIDTDPATGWRWPARAGRRGRSTSTRRTRSRRSSS